jgi:hypothetical protein
MLVFHRLFRYFLVLSVLLATILVLWPALSGGFIFDDYPVFADNPVVRIDGWHWQAWLSLWRWSHANIQRPFAMASYALNYALGASIWGFKATNLAIHVLNTLLVFLLSRRLLSAAWSAQGERQSEKTLRSADYWALGVTAAWAVHPLQVSTVMYVVQRMELLGFTFVLSALLAYWRARQLQLQGRPGWGWLLICGCLIAIGFYAKETAALVPGYALVIELTLLGFSAARPAIARNWGVAYILGCLMAVIVFVIYVLPQTSAASFAVRDYTAWQRELTQLRALTMYLGWILLPLPGQLHFYYDNYQASLSLLDPITTLISAIVVLGMLALAVAFRHRRPLLALGITWFFLAHLLTSSPLPLELVFEHRNYPALLGIMLALADIVWMARHRMKSIFPAILALVFIANLAYLTVLRAATWGNPLQLATTLAQTNPGSPRAALDLARRYVTMSGNKPGTPLYALGIQELERAAQLPSSSILPEDALLIQAAKDPSVDTARWWASLEQKLQNRPLGPETYLALHGLWQARLENDPKIDAQQLARAFEIVIARNPTRLSLRVEYAELAYRALNDLPLATAQWQQAIAIQKGAAEYTRELATYLIDNRRPQEAIAVIAKADALQPQLQHDATISALRSQAEAIDLHGHTKPGS